jgi:hypothetical protein
MVETRADASPSALKATVSKRPSALPTNAMSQAGTDAVLAAKISKVYSAQCDANQGVHARSTVHRRLVSATLRIFTVPRNFNLSQNQLQACLAAASV